MKILTILGIATAFVLAVGLLAVTGHPPDAFGSPSTGAEAFVMESMGGLSVIDQVLLIAAFCVAIALIVWQARPIETSPGRREHAGNDNRHLRAADPRPPG